MGGCSCGRAFQEVRVGHSGAGSWVDCVKDSRDGRPGSAEARSQGERARGREGQAEVGEEKLASSVRGRVCATRCSLLEQMLRGCSHDASGIDRLQGPVGASWLVSTHTRVGKGCGVGPGAPRKLQNSASCVVTASALPPARRQLPVAPSLPSTSYTPSEIT